MKNKYVILLVISFLKGVCIAQNTNLKGKVTFQKQPIELVQVFLKGTKNSVFTDSKGVFLLDSVAVGTYQLVVIYDGYTTHQEEVVVVENTSKFFQIELKEIASILEDVVVTGASQATKIKENPIVVSVVSAKQLDRNITSNIVDNLALSVPGLNVIKTGANISKPIIRGLGYNRVLTLYDGIRQEGQQWGDEHGLEVDNYNIEKVEVIKGPASLMYGSDALAGVVSFFPAMPKNKDVKLHGKLTSEYQSNNNLIGNGLQLNWNKGKWIMAWRGSIRLAKNYQNPIDGRVYLTNFNEKNTSYLVGYQASKGYIYANFTLYDNRQGIPDGSRDSLSRKFTKQIDEADNDDILNREIVTDKELNSYKIPLISQRIQHYRMYLKSFWKVGRGNIDWNIGIQQNNRREFTHPTVPTQAGMFVRLNTLNYSVRYTAPKMKAIELAIGWNGMLQQNKNKDATVFPIPNYMLVDAGIFVFSKWRSEKWTVSGGVRYDVRHYNWSDFYVATDVHSGFEYRSNKENISSRLAFDAYEKNFQGISASVGATYQVSSTVALKANIGRAFRAPNVTEIASNGLDPGAHIIYLGNKNFSPEFLLQEDIGVLAKFKSLSFEVNLFNNHIQDYIYLTMKLDEHGQPLVDNQGNKTYQYQQSNAQLLGGEVWVALHPEKLKGLRWGNSWSYVVGYNRSTLFRNKGTQGEYLPFIPPMRFLSRLSYDLEIQKWKYVTITPMIEMETNAAQNNYLGLNNTETFTGAYTLLNIGTSIRYLFPKKYALMFNFQISNLANKAYQSNLNRLKYFEHYASSLNGRTGIYNMGRNASVKLVFEF